MPPFFLGGSELCESEVREFESGRRNSFRLHALTPPALVLSTRHLRVLRHLIVAHGVMSLHVLAYNLKRVVNLLGPGALMDGMRA